MKSGYGRKQGNGGTRAWPPPDAKSRLEPPNWRLILFSEKPAKAYGSMPPKLRVRRSSDSNVDFGSEILKKDCPEEF